MLEDGTGNLRTGIGVGGQTCVKDIALEVGYHQSVAVDDDRIRHHVPVSISGSGHHDDIATIGIGHRQGRSGAALDNGRDLAITIVGDRTGFHKVTSHLIDPGQFATVSG